MNLKRVGESTTDLTNAFKAVQKTFLDLEAQNFDNENARGRSGRWKPLSPSYEKAKIARFGTFALLAGVERATDKLYKSLTGKTSDSVERIDKQEAVFGTTVPYAKAQHYGSQKQNLPSRPLIDFSDEQLKEIGKVIRKEIAGEVKRRTTLKVTEIGDI